MPSAHIAKFSDVNIPPSRMYSFVVANTELKKSLYTSSTIESYTNFKFKFFKIV